MTQTRVILKKLVLDVCILLKFNSVIQKLENLRWKIYVEEINRKHGKRIKFIEQGTGGLCIAGDLSKFEMHSTSHLKSDTFIDCSGGVKIGRFFHTGRGLTIFSTSHNYMDGSMIPYDDVQLDRPVVIEDFVWVGANVTLVPGITVGEGSVIGAGSVVAKDVPRYAVVAGNPAKVIKYRDADKFERLKAEGLFN
jgi:acetyltransferase-like isoleucine patch superfamily enzyme